jgi:stringent starvation protein A
VITLYDADRCPYCARVRILLAEKQVPYDTVVVDLDDRPAWIYEKNPLGRVPVLEEDEFVLPESAVINEYLEERYPEPPLLPADPADRAAARLLVFRFDRIGDAYYALRRGQEDARPRFYRRLGELDSRLAFRPYLTGAEYGLTDIAYVPWILCAQARMGVDLDRLPHLREWVERLLSRPAVAAESELVAAL